MKSIFERIHHYNLTHNKNFNIEASQKNDIVLVWPNSKAKVEQLQDIVDFVKEITGRNLGLLQKEDLPPTILVGCSRGQNEPVWAYNKYYGNTVILPQNYLCSGEQPLEACTHELVHPFLHKSKIGNWGDGFCDFLRIFILRFLNLNLKWEINGKKYDWIDFMKENVYRKGDCWDYHTKALRLLRKYQNENFCMKDKKHLARYIRPLLNKTELELENAMPQIQV